MIKRLISLLFLLCVACTGGKSTDSIKLGVDPSWAPLNFAENQPYINGFVGDVLMELAEYTGVSFEKVTLNQTMLFEALLMQKLEGALTSLPRYNYNEAKYTFSDNFLDLGPVLVVPKNSSYPPFKKWRSGVVGVLENSVSTEIIEMHSHVVFKEYPSVPELLDGVVAGEIDAALHERIPTISYLRDLYQDSLQLAQEPPFNDAGLHLILLKRGDDRYVWKFNEGLKRLKKKGRIDELLKKWQLQ